MRSLKKYSFIVFIKQFLLTIIGVVRFFHERIQFLAGFLLLVSAMLFWHKLGMHEFLRYEMNGYIHTAEKPSRRPNEFSLF